MRRKYTTTIDEVLLERAMTQARLDNLDGANTIIEEALRMYFARIGTDTYEKKDKNTIYKWICYPNHTVLEIIKQRINFNQKFNDTNLEQKGFVKL